MKKFNKQLGGGSLSKIAAPIMTGEFIFRLLDAFSREKMKSPNWDINSFSCALPSGKSGAD